MPASGKTVNYELPLYKPLDTVSEMVTFNGAMSAIDTQMKANETAGGTNKALIEGVKTDVDSLEESMNILTEKYDNEVLEWFSPTVTESAGANIYSLKFMQTKTRVIGTICARLDLNIATKTVRGSSTEVQIATFPENFNFTVSDNPNSPNRISRLLVFASAQGVSPLPAQSSVICYRINNSTILSLLIPSVNIENMSVLNFDGVIFA